MALTGYSQFDTSPLNKTLTADLNLKFNLPYSAAPLPKYLSPEMPFIAPRVSTKVRKDIHSYFKPSMADVVREIAKGDLRKHLVIESLPQPHYADDRKIIPEDTLFAVLGTEHIKRKQQKDELITSVRKTTFSNA